MTSRSAYTKALTHVLDVVLELEKDDKIREAIVSNNFSSLLDILHYPFQDLSQLTYGAAGYSPS